MAPNLLFFTKNMLIDKHLLTVLLLLLYRSNLRPRFAYIFGHYGHARSQGGRQSAASKPRLYNVFFRYLYTRISFSEDFTSRRHKFEWYLRLENDTLLDFIFIVLSALFATDW